ncbi:MAG: hypothetical protein ACKN9K_15110, partial [Dolichospermum sp.]
INFTSLKLDLLYIRPKILKHTIGEYKYIFYLTVDLTFLKNPCVFPISASPKRYNVKEHYPYIPVNGYQETPIKL